MTAPAAAVSRGVCTFNCRRPSPTPWRGPGAAVAVMPGRRRARACGVCGLVDSESCGTGAAAAPPTRAFMAHGAASAPACAAAGRTQSRRTAPAGPPSLRRALIERRDQRVVGSRLRRDGSVRRRAARRSALWHDSRRVQLDRWCASPWRQVPRARGPAGAGDACASRRPARPAGRRGRSAGPELHGHAVVAGPQLDAELRRRQRRREPARRRRLLALPFRRRARRLGPSRVGVWWGGESGAGLPRRVPRRRPRPGGLRGDSTLRRGDGTAPAAPCGARTASRRSARRPARPARRRPAARAPLPAARRPAPAQRPRPGAGATSATTMPVAASTTRRRGPHGGDAAAGAGAAGSSSSSESPPDTDSDSDDAAGFFGRLFRSFRCASRRARALLEARRGRRAPLQPRSRAASSDSTTGSCGLCAARRHAGPARDDRGRAPVGRTRRRSASRPRSCAATTRALGRRVAAGVCSSVAARAPAPGRAREHFWFCRLVAVAGLARGRRWVRRRAVAGLAAPLVAGPARLVSGGLVRRGPGGDAARGRRCDGSGSGRRRPPPTGRRPPPRVPGGASARAPSPARRASTRRASRAPAGRGPAAS